MRALIKANAAPGLTLRSVDEPVASPYEAVLRIHSASICGTDAHIDRWDEWAQSRVQLPRILGHELYGEVVSVGSGGTLVREGDLVAVESHLTCGVCFQCRTGQGHVCQQYRILGVGFDGGFADYVRLPERLLWKVPQGVPAELACLHEPLGNAVYAALVEDLAGKSVLITGCGPSGLMAAAVARRAGAACVMATDISEYRLDLAKRIGVDHAWNVSQVTREQVMSLVRRATLHEGVDVALEMSGDAEALGQAFQAVRNGGESVYSACRAAPCRSIWRIRSFLRGSASMALPVGGCSTPGTTSLACFGPG